MELAWWFNVGVQIFLCMSGFLYGQKDVRKISVFYACRLRKILIPYYIVFILFGIFQLIFAKDVFNLSLFIRGLFLNAQPSGGEHLWFVSTILMCYVLTPLLTEYRDCYVKERKSFIVFTVLSIVIISLFFGAFDKFFNPAWISCYALGYTFGVNEIGQYVKSRLLVLILGTMAIMCNGVQIYCIYIANRTFQGSEIIFSYNHMILGSFIFLVTKQIFDRMHLKRIEKILSITDAYSYEIYLVHQFIILGSFSLMDITGFLSLNIVIILIGICLLSYFVKCFEKMVEYKAKWKRGE